MYYNVCRPQEVEKVIVYKPFGSFKNLKKLIIPETFLWKYVQMAKKIRGLERLRFVMTEAQIAKYPTLFRNLSSLQILHLKIFDDNRNLALKTDDEKSQIVSLTWRFFRDLMNLKHLKELTLILEDCLITKDYRFAEDFLELLAKSTVERYHLTLPLSLLEDIRQTSEINKALSEVDSLDMVWNFYYYGFESASEKKKTIIFLFPEKSNINISNLLSKFSHLKFLTLNQTHGGTVTFNIPQPNPHLEALKLNVDLRQESKAFELMKFAADYVANSQLKSIYLRLAHLPDDIFKQLLRIHDSLSPLKTEKYELDLANPKNWSYIQRDSENPTPLVPLDTETLRLLTSKISELISLKVLYLELYLKGAESVQYIEQLFSHLPNLTKLELRLYHESPVNFTMMTMPVYNSKKLEHVRLDFSETFKFANLIEFFEGVSQLEELDELNIHCVGMNSMNKETKDKIAHILSNLKKCSKYTLGHLQWTKPNSTNSKYYTIVK